MYDYVIVGAGSAGCVLASRLTEDPSTRVLLLEAGGPDRADEIRVPAAYYRLFKTAYDWDYVTAGQRGLGDRRVYWPRGRTLGGSSSMNAMVYIRGSRLDYDTWRDSYGCDGWSYSDLLPYFRRAEDQARGESEHHGVGGPLRIEDLRRQHKLTRAFVDAATSYGLERTDDFNALGADDGAGGRGSAGFYQVTQQRGRRFSAADAYLRPALDRPNLTVRTDALVESVLIEQGRAVGVRYLHEGEQHQDLAHREVVLSAGTVGSAQLLLLSGVGPGEHLRSHGIDVVADMPEVGENLQDHPAVTPMWWTPKVRNFWEREKPLYTLLWRLLGRGPLATNVVESGGFARSRDDLPAPDLQFHALPSPFLDQGLVEPPGRALTILTALVSVASRGRITLRSADPRWKPDIDPGYLASAADRAALIEGVRIARAIAAEPPLAELVNGEYHPGAKLRTTEELGGYVRREVQTLYHPVGTCAMGGSERAVCDPRLRVRGVAGLRVVDASVMPAVPRGNTNAPTIAIAERAADLITGAPVLEPRLPGERSGEDDEAGADPEDDANAEAQTARFPARDTSAEPSTGATTKDLGSES